jgi:hypothetical protein
VKERETALVSRILCSLLLALEACSPPARDTVPDTRDVRVTPDAGAGATPSKDGYAYVVRRPHGAVGLVGAHFMSDADARRVVDHIADDLETCARRLEQRGDLVEGAVQLVAFTGSRGSAEVSDIRFAPGGPVAANALECIVAPLRATAFPAVTPAGLPAVAIEATWAPNRAGNADAGSPL